MLLSRRFLSVIPLLVIACGGRSKLLERYDAPAIEARDAGPPRECITDIDCFRDNLCKPALCREEQCVPLEPVDCDDSDPCTKDSCVPSSGDCRHRRLTEDADEDGYFAALPGYVPGAPDSCGDDCDDSSALAHPGGQEVCDGVDNDCNGIVDDGSRFIPSSFPAVRVSMAGVSSNMGDLIFGKEYFLLGYASRLENMSALTSLISPSHEVLSADTPLTKVNNDTFAPRMAFSGSVAGVAWEDRRDQNYEIYFNRLTPAGEKMGEDIRLTLTGNFSVDPVVVWTGIDFLVAWVEIESGRGKIYAIRVDSFGAVKGSPQLLSGEYSGATAPSLAVGNGGIALLFTAEVNQTREPIFRLFDAELKLKKSFQLATSNGATGTLVSANGPDFIVSYEELSASKFSNSIQAAVISESGDLKIAPTQIIARGDAIRSHDVVPLGNRFLIAWSELGVGQPTYDLQYAVFSSSLDVLETPQVLLAGATDEIIPRLALGGGYGVGVAYTSTSGLYPEIWFTSLSCSQ